MAGARAYRGPSRPSAAASAFDALRRTIKDSDIAFNRLLSESIDNDYTPPDYVDPKVNITTDSSSCSPDTSEIKIDKNVPSLVKKKFKRQKPKFKFKKRVELFLSHEKENSVNLKSHNFDFDQIGEGNSNTSQILKECIDDWSILKKTKDDSANLSSVSFDHSGTSEARNILIQRPEINFLKVTGNVLPICSTPCKKSSPLQRSGTDLVFDKTQNSDGNISPIKYDTTIPSPIKFNVTFENINNLSNINILENKESNDKRSVSVLEISDDCQRHSPDLFHSSRESLENFDKDDQNPPSADVSQIEDGEEYNSSNSKMENSAVSSKKLESSLNDDMSISNTSKQDDNSIRENQSFIDDSNKSNKTLDDNSLDTSEQIYPNTKTIDSTEPNNISAESVESNYRTGSISNLFINTRNRSNKYSIINFPDANRDSTILEVSENDLETTSINLDVGRESSIPEICKNDTQLNCESGSDSTLKNDSTDSSILSNSLASLKSRINHYDNINSDKLKRINEVGSFKRLTNIFPPRRSVRLENFRLTKIKEGEPANTPDDTEEEVNDSIAIPNSRHSIILQPGKKWNRSLSIIRHANALNSTTNTTINDCFNQTANRINQHRGRKYQMNVDKVMNLQNKTDASCTINNTFSARRSTVRIVEEQSSDLSNADESLMHEKFINEIFSVNCDDTKVNFSRLSISEYNRSTALIDEIDPGDLLHWKDLSARDVVLRRCNQTYFLPFDDCYPERKLRNCRKIGEGVYGEVFLYKNEQDPTKPIVMKVIPIEGTTLINGERQKKFNEILSEIVIAMELSDLRKNDYNKTLTFNKVNQVRCVQGRYPERLLELWDLYDDVKGSENDCPSVFEDDQLYVVLELANGGDDLESFTFADATQSYSLFFQIIHALAVAEEAFQFEHRDLHWGNILVTQTDDQNITFVHRGVEYPMPTNGVSATVIDFTLSRMSVPQVACTIFNDLSTDEDLFDADGDYQFEIYRLMRKKNCNNWQRFEPFTNILWMDYILGKMIKGLRYDNVKSKTHTLYINKLKKIKNKILNYNSCADFILNEEF